MAQVSTITIGSDTFSVYALTADPVADADSYHAGRIGSTWSTATTLQKQQALISATRFIDRAVIWSGTQTDTVTPQPLQWPRDNAKCDGVAVPDGTIPDAFALAVFEMAQILFTDSTVQDGTGTGSNVKRVKAGSAEVEFFTPTIGVDGGETRLPTVVNDLVGCYIDVANTTGSLSYGTTDDDGKSSFDCDDQHNLNRGYP